MILLLALTTLASAAPCESAYTAEQVSQALASTIDGFTPGAFTEPYRTAHAKAMCVSEVLPTDDVARIHQLVALLSFDAGKPERTTAALRAAYRADPGLSLPGPLRKAHPELGKLERGARKLDYGDATVIRPPHGVSFQLDGSDSPQRPIGQPGFVQLLAAGQVGWNGYLAPGATIPANVNLHTVPAADSTRAAQRERHKVNVELDELVNDTGERRARADAADFADAFRERVAELGYDNGARDGVYIREGDEADFVVGGRVRWLDVGRRSSRSELELTIDWEVIDTKTGTIVYSGSSRGFAGLHDTWEEQTLAAAVDALAQVTGRDTFQGALDTNTIEVAEPTWQGKLPIQACDDATAPLPEGIEPAMASTVTIRAGGGHGSGVSVSPDGFIMTAAHVPGAQTEVTVVTATGQELVGRVIRSHSPQDVAVVHVDATDFPCRSLASGIAKPGSSLWVIGSPQSEDLELSVSKGIVSGHRTMQGQRYLQTDAAISPGNSGGPMFDSQGRVAGIVNMKIVKTGVEGIAFGIPTEAVVGALDLQMGSKSAVDLPGFGGTVGHIDAAHDPLLNASQLTPPFKPGVAFWTGSVIAGAGAVSMGTGMALNADPNFNHQVSDSMMGLGGLVMVGGAMTTLIAYGTAR